MPVYLVTYPGDDGEVTKLVDVANARAAVNHVIKSAVKAEALTASEVAEYMTKGYKFEKVVETAGNAAQAAGD